MKENPKVFVENIEIKFRKNGEKYLVVHPATLVEQDIVLKEANAPTNDYPSNIKNIAKSIFG